jgi:hypothetical protein
MPPKLDKLVLTNFSALKVKYGKAGLEKIQAAVDKLIAADAERGLVTKYLGIDDVPAMKKIGAKAVGSAINRKENKTTVDQVYKALAPDYILLLGSIDVIPHQDMKNPMYAPGPDGDPDKYAYGDLPYACEAEYSQRPQTFIGPTRVVGRLPDLTGANDPAYLIGLLKTATNYKTTTASAYKDYLGITAEVWKASTTQSVERTFGTADNLNSVPPKDFKWAKNLLARKALFVNCHGNRNTPYFSGQSVANPDDYPDSLRADWIDHKITEGTLAAVECCYGGQLYDPERADGQQGVANTYLENKAYAFFGSTTIAYGPASGNGQADLLCQYFLINVLGGASIGRAVLQARQKFARTVSLGNPSNIKTIAQFNLYGDPSLSPVKVIDPKHGSGPKCAAKGVKESEVDRVDRASRRRSLFIDGATIALTRSTSRESKKKPSRSLREALHKNARAMGIKPVATKSFVSRAPKKFKDMPSAMLGEDLVPSGYHVVLGKEKTKRKKGRRATKSPGPPPVVALIAKEVKGRLVSVTKIYGK